MISRIRLEQRDTIHRIVPLADKSLPLSLAGLLPTTRLVVLRELLQRLERLPPRGGPSEFQPEAQER